MVVLLDQVFAVKDGELTYDFFRPNADGPFPLVVFFHGGGWISGDKTMYRDEAIWLAQQGFACACPSYRLAPLYPFPVPVADCQAFLKHLVERAPEMNADSERMTVIGNSAGGHLALMAGLCPTDFNDSTEAFRPRAVVSICGISDLCQPYDSSFAISMSFIEQLMDGGREGNEERWRQASPVSYIDQAHGRFLLIHGTDDDVVPIEQSRRLHLSLQNAGLQSKLVELDGEMHSFSYPGWEKIREEYSAFLQQQPVVSN